MNRRVWALGLSITVAACSSGAPDPQAQPAPVSPTPVAVQTPTAPASTSVPTPIVSEPEAAGRVVAYGSDGGVWIANVDGTGARELLPDVADGEPLAWSADGSRLLFRQGLGFGLTDPAGLEPVTVDLRCPPIVDADADLASCEADRSVSLSPDGTRIAYPIWEGALVQGSPVTSSLVVMDLATGLVTRVGSTQSAIAGTCGENRTPRWSPDGRRLAFVRTTGSDGNFDCPEALLTVNIDGTDMRQILSPGQVTGDLEANWSPDGSRIVADGFVGSVNVKERAFGGDVYTVRSDGSDFHALTSDGLSGGPSWTHDGRIVFIRWMSNASTSRGDLWVMDADGRNATLLEATVPALTAAGCVRCWYPVYHQGIDLLKVRQTPPLERFWGTGMLWQP